MESQPWWNPTIRYAVGLLLLLFGAATVNSVSFASLAAGAGLFIVVTTTIGVMERLLKQTGA